MTDKIYTIEEIKSISYPILKKYNITDVYLFGSYSRGEATSASDIDFKATTPKGMSLFTVTHIINELEDAFQKHIDFITVDYSELDAEFLFYLCEDEVKLYA